MGSVNKVLILSTSNPYKTAGIAAYDIFKGFKNMDYHVKLIVENYDKYENDIVSIQGRWEYYFNMLINKFRNRVQKFHNKFFKQKSNFRTKKEYSFDGIVRRNREYSTKKILNKAGFTPDVIIVIFSQYFISYKNLVELQEITNAPIYWQFADMFPFTGGCHYAWECAGFKSSCNNCPAFIDEKYNNYPNKILSKKKSYIKDLDVTAIIGSDWLIERAKQSSLFKSKPIQKIFLSVDSNLFSPFEPMKKLGLRDFHNIGNDCFVILIMANHLGQKRKGVDIILDAIDLLNDDLVKEKNIHLLIVGKGFENIESFLPGGVPFTYIEFVDRNKLPDLYNMSDLFCSASLQEVGPYTLTEALLCEVPVVSLRHGYSEDFVIDGTTGFLVKKDTPKAFAKGIESIFKLGSIEFVNMKSKCRAENKNLGFKRKANGEFYRFDK